MRLPLESPCGLSVALDDAARIDGAKEDNNWGFSHCLRMIPICSDFVTGAALDSSALAPLELGSLLHQPPWGAATRSSALLLATFGHSLPSTFAAPD